MYFRKIVTTLLTLLLVLVMPIISIDQTVARQTEGQKIRLSQPPFLTVAYAQEQPFDAATIEAIVDEAGISAYFNRGGTINLNQVRGLYRTIESDTDTYLTGLMQVKTDTYSYSEGEDVHVYVSTSGWVLAYYLNSNASAKIFDVVGFTGSTINTKLEIVLSRVATAIGIGSSYTPTFYDFRYPNATHLQMIGEKTNQQVDSFQINVPSSFTVDERSWVFYASPQSTSFNRCSFNRCKFTLNDTVLAVAATTNETKFGTLQPNQLLADTTHTLSVSDEFQSSTVYSIGALVLTYREPQQ